MQDYWYWQATNTATVWGFDAIAEALADFGHPAGAASASGGEGLSRRRAAGAYRIAHPHARRPAARRNLRAEISFAPAPSRPGQRLDSRNAGGLDVPARLRADPRRRAGDRLDSQGLRGQSLYLRSIRLFDSRVRAVLVLARGIFDAGQPARRPAALSLSRRGEALSPRVFQRFRLGVLSRDEDAQRALEARTRLSGRRPLQDLGRSRK